MNNNRSEKVLVNVGRDERFLSMAAGAVLISSGLIRLPFSAILLLASGVYMVYRGFTGRCTIYEKAGIDTAVDLLPHIQNNTNSLTNGVTETLNQADEATGRTI